VVPVDPYAVYIEQVAGYDYDAEVLPPLVARLLAVAGRM